MQVFEVIDLEEAGKYVKMVFLFPSLTKPLVFYVMFVRSILICFVILSVRQLVLCHVTMLADVLKTGGSAVNAC